MKKIRVVIADDHDLFRSGLIELLRKNKDIEVVGEAKDGLKLLNFLENNVADVVLLDLTMPQMDGFEVLDRIRQTDEKVRVIIISMHDDGNYIAKCARLGAAGYLLKNSDEYELISAIKRASEGSKYFNHEISERMINFMQQEESNPSKISHKEHEVLTLLAQGHTTKEIAAQLYISTRTVETHRANLLKKQGVKNTAELVRKAMKDHLI